MTPILSHHPWLYTAIIAALCVAGIWWLARTGPKPPKPPAVNPGKGYRLATVTIPGWSYHATRDGVNWFSITPHQPLSFDQWKTAMPQLLAIRERIPKEDCLLEDNRRGFWGNGSGIT